MDGLRMSQLVQRMHEGGFSQDVIDNCFEAASPKSAAIAMLRGGFGPA
eukprot:SAG11_NODE_27005_length_338_cov_0.870293_1_plen_47_part_10